MCFSAPKIKPANPALPPPPVEKSVDSMGLGEELQRKAMGSRSGINKLKIDRKL